jgi:hypothetical protein
MSQPAFLRGREATDEGQAVFIQWKGTNVCLDFVCACGNAGHFDGDFAYVLQCAKCGTEWEMPVQIYPRRSERNDIQAREVGA